MTASMQLLTKWYGLPSVKGLLRFVYSPRSGWGYSRIPMFVVSEEYGLSLTGHEFGLARDFHGNGHELSHFWWMIANPDLPDDWINEGLAEFSAFRLSKFFYGEEFAKELIQEYQKHAVESGTETSIVETEADSPDRYINRYEKTTLLFIEARHRFGDRLDQVFKSLYSTFRGTREATTEAFFEAVKEHLGDEGDRFFREGLHRKNWSAMSESAIIPESGSDP